MRRTRLAFLGMFAGLSLASGCSHGGGSTPPPVVVPAAPTNVQAAAADGAVTLQWAPAANAASYCVYYASSPDVSPGNWGTCPDGHRLAPATSPLVITGLTNGTTYTFVVTAWNAAADRESEPSLAVQATPIAPGIPGYTTPITQPAFAITGTGASLAGRLTNPNGYTTSVSFEYGITSSTGASTTPQLFAAAGVIDVTASLSGLQPLTTYHYRLVTQNTGGTFAGGDGVFVTLAEPQVLLGSLDQPTGLCTDGTYVYCFEVYGGRVRRVDPATGATATLATVAAVGNTGAAAVYGGYVYFANDAAVYRVGTNGTGFTSWASLGETTALLAHASGLYVRHGQSLTWISPDGVQVVTLYVRTPQSSEGFGGGLAVDATHVYWTDYFRGTVEKLAFAGGPKVVLALDQNHPYHLLLEGGTLWFATEDGLRRVPAAGGAVTPVSAASGAFTKVGDVMYVASSTDVFTVDTTTGAPTMLVTGANFAAYPPVVTGSRIVWLRAGDHWYPPLGALLWIDRP